jgi:hypothetical protein
MTRWNLPEPLELGFEFRSKGSAKITQRVLDDGRLQTVVAHAPMLEVTPEMCLWFLENVDRQVSFRGHRALAYRFWHPRDHIHFKRQGKFGPGDRWHIVEAFGRDPRFMVDDLFHVVDLDDTGFVMEVRLPVGTVAIAEERWVRSDAGLLWTVTMTAGFTKAPACWFNGAVRRRRAEFIRRWSEQHNPEEAGCLPQFLPEMYAERAKLFQ